MRNRTQGWGPDLDGDTVSEVFNHERQMVAVQGVARDITGQRKAAESIALFRALVDRANDAIEVVDPQSGRILDINEKASEIHGYTRDEYLKLTVSQINPVFTGGGKGWEAHVEKLEQTGSMVFESEHRRKDGSIFQVEINSSYIHLERDYILAVVRDITERKRVDRRLHQLNRIYAVLSGINELIVRERNIGKMIEGACRIAVKKEVCAWHGSVCSRSRASPSGWPATPALRRIPSPRSSAYSPIQRSGALLRSVLWKPAGTPRATTSPALRSPPPGGRSRSSAATCRSSLLPLNISGIRRGVFNLYAGEEGFFDADELRPARRAGE